MKKKLTLFMVALVAVAAFAGLRRAATAVTLDFTKGDVITAMGYELPESGKSVDLTGPVTYQGITITPKHGTTNTRFWNASGEYQLRYYNTGGMGIAVPEGNKINQIVINGNSVLEKTIADVGTVEHSNGNKTLTWTPAAGTEVASVVFTNNGGKATNVLSIVVDYEAASGDVLTDKTVTFINDANWEKVYVWAWNDSENFTGGQWPGVEITPIEGVYTWSTTGNPAYIIFSNGLDGDAKQQTADLAFEDGATYNSQGKVVPEPELKDFSVTFTTDAGWEKVYAYAWNEDNTPLVQWPGVEITATKNSEGVYTYAFQAVTAPTGIIFNNGLDGDAKQQTADLAFENGKAYSYSTPKDVTTLDFTTVDIASVPSEYVGNYGNLDNYTIVDADQGVKMLIKNNEATNNCRFWNNVGALQLRVYNGASLTFEPIEEGKVIKKITFDASNWGTENSTDVETLTDKEWAGSAAKVVLTIAGGKTFFEKITVEVGDAIAPVLNTYTATFKNEASWNAVYAYAWTTTGEGDAATTKEYLGKWPGTQLTFNSETGLFDVTINATEAPANILFHSGVEGEKTADLEFENGKQYTNKVEVAPATISKVEIRGGKVGDWDSFSKNVELVLGEDGVYTAVLDLTELTGSDYAFKLVVTPSEGEPIWIGTGSDLVLNGDYVYKDPETVDKDLNLFHHNANFATYTATATWNPNSNAASGWTLTIDGKDPRQSESLFTYHVVGTADLCGAEWLATANEMTKNAESGLYEWSAQGITVSATSQPEFKIAVNNNADPENVETVAWYPVSDATGANNWVITPEYLGDEGVYTITITFNAETKEISVVGERTGDVPEPAPTPLYTLEVGNTFKSGETVDVKDGGEVVATITYGEENGADFKAAKADSHVPGYTAFTEGNGTNGDKAGGTFYTIVPKYDGTVSVAVVLNADKKFYIEEEGTALEGYNEMTVAEKYYGTFEFEVKAGKSYKVYCAGSKLGFYGFDYTYEKSDTYTVAGTEDLTGYDWDKTKNEMTLNAETGQYEWKAENISVSDKAQPAFKIVKNAGKDDEAWYPEGDGTTNWVITPEYLGAEGVYTISIAFNAATKDITVTGEKTGEIEPELALGDVNGDSEVTTTDAVMAVDFALGKSVPTTAQFNAANVVKADAGAEEAITVADAIGIVNIALEIPNGDPAAGARLFDEGNNFLTLNGQTLSLTNSTAFAGFQMDVTLAEGAQFNGAQLTERASNLNLVYNRIGENTWRIIVLSLQGNTISGSNGALLTLDIMGNSTVSVSNIEFADGEANAYALGFGGATGINGVYGVSADSDIYNVNGVRTNTMHKGMNIIRNANGEVKKVFVK
jgi:hypothetical protein